MGFISPFTLIRALSLFHITAAYFFLAAPRMIADQNIVFILGEAMKLPAVTTLDKPSEASAFIAVLLAFFGVSDLTAASLSEQTALEYWLANVPARLAFLFGLTGYTYLFKEDGMLGSKSLQRASVGETLQNNLVFSWAFLELIAWFWIFTNLRDERRNVVKRMIEQREAERDRL